MINVVGANIKKYRKEKNMTQGELAQMLDMERSAISRIENGQNDVNSQSLYKFAEALGVSIIDFYRTEDFSRSMEFLPYLDKADEGTLLSIRKLLDMPPIKKRRI